MSENRFYDRYGPAALIFGGSEGIGRSFAEALARAGLDLVLVARTASRLEAAAAEIRAAHGVKVDVEPLDLHGTDAADRIAALGASREFGLIVYNAGATQGIGRFAEQPASYALDLVRLNCIGPVAAAHACLPAMIARGRGGLILVSSVSALAGAGYIATYAATKSFEIILAEGLHWELDGTGVDVLCAVAGLTDTPAMVRSGMMANAAAGAAMSADAVVEGALAALGEQPVWYASGDPAIAAMRAMPRAELSEMMTRTTMSLGGLD